MPLLVLARCMIKTAPLTGFVMFNALLCHGQQTQEPLTFFREHIGLTDHQIALIDRGYTVAKVLPSKTPSEIFVFGAVFVRAEPEECAKLAFDMSRLKRLTGYLGAGRLSEPPQLSELEGFTLEPEDIRNLKVCRPGKCEVQLPAAAIQELQKLSGSEPNVAARMNDKIRDIALGILRRYREGGNRVLGIYHDSDCPFDVDAQLRSLLGRSDVLPIYLPELNRYLLDYPKATLPKGKDLFYWERVNFGLKPTLRLNHAIAYPAEGQGVTAQVIAVKQLYASHYLQLALDLTACVAERGRNPEKGFYLISLRGSRQRGLTGWAGSLVRRIAVRRAYSAQEKSLINLKKALEDQP